MIEENFENQHSEIHKDGYLLSKKSTFQVLFLRLVEL